MIWFALSLVGCIDANAPVSEGDDEPFVFEVPAGSSANGLAKKLESNGLINSPFDWKLFLRQRDGSCLKAGKFEVKRSFSMNELLDTLCGTPLSDEVPFTIIEGWRIREIDAALVGKGWIEPGDYKSIAESKSAKSPFEITSPTFEGYLYPDTYMVDPNGFEPRELIERQLKTFQKRFLANADLKGRTLHEVVVMASMLEREEPTDSQRPVVSGILWKRVDNHWNLGVDATSRYTLEKWNDRGAFLKKLRDESDPYNTRLKQGLPPTPIGNPAISALTSAVKPKKSEWWYYLHDKDGVLHPAKNSAGHTRNRQKYGVW